MIGSAQAAAGISGELRLQLILAGHADAAADADGVLQVVGLTTPDLWPAGLIYDEDTGITYDEDVGLRHRELVSLSHREA